MTERNEREQAARRLSPDVRGKSMAHNSLFRDRFPLLRSTGIIRSLLSSFSSARAPFSPVPASPNLDQWRRLGEKPEGRLTEEPGSSVRSRMNAQKPPFFRQNSKFGRGWIIFLTPPSRELPLLPAVPQNRSPRSEQSSLRILAGCRRIHSHFVPTEAAEFTSDVGKWRPTGCRGERRDVEI